MVRRHGWQLPAHTLQVAAITVFFLLAIAYYIFLAPFLWFNSLVIAAYAVYSPLAFAVFVLYVRCTAINPADPGVLEKQQHPGKIYEKAFSESSFEIGSGPLRIGSSAPSSIAPSLKGSALREASMEEGQLQRQRPPSICSCAGLCGLLCGWMVASDDCCRFSEPPPPVMEDEILFCTLCNAEVRRFSKHCRSCDKCVDGFDHHCRWLNNCIGKKNYRTFVALMSTSLLLLIVEGIVGTAVFVRCFVDRHRIMEHAMDKLGNGFTRVPFASVVAVCTVMALLACIPLGELFFFHLILIKKGITTYEYVVAVRAQPGDSPIEEEVITSTSASTAPGMSRSSSLGLQQHGGWCTPPRIFIEHQDEAIPNTVAGTLPPRIPPEHQQNNPQKSRPGNVRISAWRLAKLDKAEATRAAANARKASSVLRPISQAPPELKELSDSEQSYTSDSSPHSTSGISTAYGTPLPPRRNGEDVSSSMSLSPYKSELPRIRTGREPAVIATWTKSLGMEMKSSDSQSDSSSKSSFPGRNLQAETTSKSSIASILRQPEPPQTFARPHPVDPSGSRATSAARPPKVAKVATLSDGYEASAGETTDDMRRTSGKGRMLMMPSRAATKASSPASGPSFGAVPYSGASNPSRTLQFGGRGISTSVLSSYQSRPSRRLPSSTNYTSTSETDVPGGRFNPGVQPSSQRFTTRHAGVGILQINEPSIFFSSPLIPIGESSRRHIFPPRPAPVPLRTSTGNSVRSNSRLVTMLPSQTSEPIDR